MQKRFFLLISLVSGLSMISNSFTMDEDREIKKSLFTAEFITTLDKDENNEKEKIVKHKIKLLEALKPGQEVFLAEQYIDHTQYKRLILKKHKEGVKIQIITGNARPNNRNVAQEMANAGIPTWMGNIHTKWAIIGDMVVFGSENASKAAGTHIECGMKTQDLELLEKLKKEFEVIKSNVSKLSENKKEKIAKSSARKINSVALPAVPVSPVAKVSPASAVPVSPIKKSPILIKGQVLITPPSTPTKLTVLSSASQKLEKFMGNLIEAPNPPGYKVHIKASTMTLGNPIAGSLKRKAREITGDKTKSPQGSIKIVLDKAAERQVEELVKAGVETVMVKDKMQHAKLLVIKHSPKAPKTPSREPKYMVTVSSANFTEDTQINDTIVVPTDSPLAKKIQDAIDQIATEGEKQTLKTLKKSGAIRKLFDGGSGTSTTTSVTKETSDDGAEK